MVKPTGLHVFLNVTNVDKSAAFYSGLGLRKLREFPPPMRVIAFDLGAGAQLMVAPSEPAPDAETAQWLKTRPLGAGALLMPQVQDVDAVHAKAKAIGAQIDQPPTDQPWGSRTLMLSDPDGYALMFEQAPPARRPAKRAKKAKAAKKPAKKASKKARRR